MITISALELCPRLSLMNHRCRMPHMLIIFPTVVLSVSVSVFPSLSLHALRYKID